MSLYRELSQNFELSPYLNKIHNRTHRKALAKLRMSPHELLIETVRHTGIPRENRKCTLCNKNDIEDEYHFVLICPLYNNTRNIYIKRYYINNPSMFKFIELLNSTGNSLKNLALYVTKAFELRNETLNNTMD